MISHQQKAKRYNPQAFKKGTALGIFNAKIDTVTGTEIGTGTRIGTNKYTSVVKANVQGSAEALAYSLSELSLENKQVKAGN